MAHNITNTDSLLLAAKPAWHGLGTILPEAFDMDTAMAAGGLNWDVHLIPLQTTALYGGPKDGERLTSTTHRAAVRGDTAEILGVVGSGYKVLQNYTMLALARNAVESMAQQLHIESCGSFKGGRKVFACIRTSTFEVAPRDEVHTYALLSNSHDGSSAFELMNTSVRVVCNNTLRMAVASGVNKHRRRHTKNMLDGVDDIIRELIAGRETAEAFASTAKNLANLTLPQTEAVQHMYEQVYISMFGKPDTDRKKRTAQAVVDDWHVRLWNSKNDLGVGSRNSYWSLLNSITEQIDHDRTQRDEDNRMHSNLYGSSAELKDAAFAAVLDLAGPMV